MKMLNKRLYPLIVDAYKQGAKDQENGEFSVEEFEKELKEKGADLFGKAKNEVEKRT